MSQVTKESLTLVGVLLAAAAIVVAYVRLGQSYVGQPVPEQAAAAVQTAD